MSFAAALALLWLVPGAAAERPLDGPLVGPVDDRSGMLSAADAARLAARARTFEAKGVSVAALLVDSTWGVDIESFCREKAAAYRAGAGEAAVLCIARSDRKARLEVNDTLRKRVPDALAAQILERGLDCMKRNAPAEAVSVVFDAIGNPPLDTRLAGPILGAGQLAVGALAAFGWSLVRWAGRPDSRTKKKKKKKERQKKGGKALWWRWPLGAALVALSLGGPFAIGLAVDSAHPGWQWEFAAIAFFGQLTGVSVWAIATGPNLSPVGRGIFAGVYGLACLAPGMLVGILEGDVRALLVAGICSDTILPVFVLFGLDFGEGGGSDGSSSDGGSSSGSDTSSAYPSSESGSSSSGSDTSGGFSGGGASGSW